MTRSADLANILAAFGLGLLMDISTLGLQFIMTYGVNI
jgi:hypothetical protein